MTSQNFASKSGSLKSLKTGVRCGLISFSLQTRCTVALETPNSRAIARAEVTDEREWLSPEHLDYMRRFIEFEKERAYGHRSTGITVADFCPLL